MTEQEPYTPSLDEVRDLWAEHRVDPRPAPDAPAEFDRMIEAVRAEERERIAREIEKGYLGPDFARRPDGSEGPEAYAAHAYDEGLEYAARIARAQGKDRGGRVPTADEYRETIAFLRENADALGILAHGKEQGA